MTPLGNNHVDLWFEETYKKSMTNYKRKTTNKEKIINHKLKNKEVYELFMNKKNCYRERIVV